MFTVFLCLKNSTGLFEGRLNKYLDKESQDDFISIFDKSKTTHQQLAWKPKYNNTRLNDNLPLLTLIAYLHLDQDMNSLDEQDSVGLIDATVDLIRSSGEKNTIGKKSLKGSYDKWLPRVRKHFNLIDQDPKIIPIDPLSKKIINFINGL